MVAEKAVGAASPRRLRYKRPLDLAILALAHIALLPIWVLLWTVIPLLVWLEDRGPVFFVQDRVGKDGRHFGLIKFRSMRMPKEREEWSGDTKGDDPRVRVRLVLAAQRDRERSRRGCRRSRFVGFVGHGAQRASHGRSLGCRTRRPHLSAESLS